MDQTNLTFDITGNRLPVQVSDAEVAIEIVDMHKRYGDFHVLMGINLEVVRGERVVVCGPSRPFDKRGRQVM
jgi:general L-amino acid transport system ATP-binding protein